MDIDYYFMKKTINLAKHGRGRVSPNPLVGALVIKNGEIIGKGYHHKTGEPHAEVLALKEAGPDAKGATLVVNLEPCCHYGKTPPCTKMIIESGIIKVVSGMEDPNPLVSGKGFAELKNAGIEVKTDILKEQCIKLNEVFLKYITSKKPFVTLKGAISLDGKVSTKTGESKWISNKKSRKISQRLRSLHDAILVGVDTVIKDNPLLTCRLDKKSKNPIRIILDSTLRIPLNSQVIKSAGTSTSPTIIVTTEQSTPEKIKTIEKEGVQVLVTKSNPDLRIDLENLLTILGEQKITSLLIEGGPTVNASALHAGIVDKLILFVAPIVIGGITTPSLVGGTGIKKLVDAFKITDLTIKKIDNNFLFEGYVSKENHVYRTN
ncbi:MAG: Riboflavin biosynthesis protein RibD [candidate division WS2 bacterium]|nr:Riboflavin biosynthesis protein RibD [Candidatus Lithacetigena glycinireducens]